MIALNSNIRGVSIKALDTDALAVSVRALDRARDYAYQERVGPMVFDPERARLSGRIRGYQDVYVPFLEDTATGVHVFCSCAAVKICAHAAALVFAKQREPWRVVEFSRIRQSADAWWQWLVEEPFPWSVLTLPDPTLLVPPGVGQGLPRVLPWSNRSVTGRHDDLLIQTAFVHPQWWQVSSFSRAFEDLWEDASLLALALRHFDQWLELAWRGPEVPLGSLWQKALGPLSDHAATIQRLLWRPLAKALDPELARRRILTCLELLEMAWGGEQIQGLEGLRQQFPWADPGGFETALFYRRMGQNHKAIQVLEAHLPDDRAARARYRELLIDWTEGDDQTGHRIADLLENFTEPKREALLQGLSPEAQGRLLQAFPALSVTVLAPDPRTE